MTVLITSLTAVFLAVLYLCLGLRVIYLRRIGIGPSIGTNDNEQFTRAVRAHGNLGEYAPLFLILLCLSEIQGGSLWVLSIISILFCLSRVSHAIGFGYLGSGPWRTLGMVGTNTSLLIVASLLCYLVLS